MKMAGDDWDVVDVGGELWLITIRPAPADRVGVGAYIDVNHNIAISGWWGSCNRHDQRSNAVAGIIDVLHEERHGQPPRLSPKAINRKQTV
jgi:hypothetical protein